MFGQRLEYAEGDVGKIDSLKQAMEGCDQVYINLKGGPSPADYVRVEEVGSKNVYIAAKESGISRIIQIGGANYFAKNKSFIVAKVKSEAEAALMASGLTYTILRPSWFYESLPLCVQDDKAVYIGSGKASFFFLAAADYARIVSKCFHTHQADNKVLTIFGPEPMPITEALRRFLAICHPHTTIQTLPVWLAKLSALMMKSKGLKMAVKLMAFYDKHDDSDVEHPPDEADRLFGRCSTTVEEWSRVYRRVVMEKE